MNLSSRSVAVTALGVAIGVTAALLGMAYPGLTDFQLFWFIAHGHAADAYDPFVMTRPSVASWAHGGGVLPFPYPPPSLLVMRPFGLLPWQVAFCTWSGAQVGLFALLAHRMLGNWAILPILSLPVLRSAFLGQTGLFVTDGAMAAFLLIKTRPILAGCILGLLGAVKPQSVIAAPFALWGRRAVLFAAAAAGSFLCAASLLFGSRLWPQWLGMMRLFPHLLPYIPAVAPSTLVPAAGKVGLATLGLAFAARDMSFVGFVLGSLLATPYIQLHDLAGLSIIGTAYVRDWWASRRNAPMAAIGAFMLICPMPAAALLIYSLAVIADRSFLKRRASGDPATPLAIPETSANLTSQAAPAVSGP